MELSRRTVADGIVVFSVQGSMDLYAMPEMKGAFRECVENGELRVAVNLQDVESLTSTGIGALIAFQTELSRKGGKLALAALSAPCRHVMALTKLSPLFQIFESEEEACRFLAEN